MLSQLFILFTRKSPIILSSNSWGDKHIVFFPKMYNYFNKLLLKWRLISAGIICILTSIFGLLVPFSVQVFFLPRQQQGQPCPARLDRHSPTRVASQLHSSCSSSSSSTHLPQPQPPATHCLNKSPSLSPFIFFLITTLSKAKNQPHFLYNLCQKEKNHKLYRHKLKLTNHLKYTISGISHQLTSLVLHSQK